MRPLRTVLILLAMAFCFAAGKYLPRGTATTQAIDNPSDFDSAEISALGVEVMHVTQETSYEMTREYLGRVESARQSELAFERAGRVKKVLVDEGDDVEADDIIAQLDTALLDAERSVREAIHNVEKAVLDELIAGPRAEAIAAARAQVTQLQADTKLAQLTADRQRRLFESGSSPRQSYDEARLGSESLAAQLDSTRARLDELLNGTRAEQVDAQRASVARAAAELAAIDVDLAKSTLRAPYTGKISRRDIDEGEVVTAGMPVLRLIESSQPEVRIGLPGSTADRLELGQSMTVLINNRECPATIARILPQRSGDVRTVDVILQLAEFDNRKLVIRDGDTATLRMKRSTMAEGSWLPLDALVEGVRGLWSCYVVRPANASDESSPAGPTDSDLEAALLPLEVVYSNQDAAFVRGPLHPGDRVIVSGVHRIVPGTKVSIASVATDQPLDSLRHSPDNRLDGGVDDVLQPVNQVEANDLSLGAK